MKWPHKQSEINVKQMIAVHMLEHQTNKSGRSICLGFISRANANRVPSLEMKSNDMQSFFSNELKHVTLPAHSWRPNHEVNSK